MTQAIAAIGPSIREQLVEATTPLVLVNDKPDPDLSVVSAVLNTPLDQREATVHLAERLRGGTSLLTHDEVTIAVPHALSDGEVRWQVLLSGQWVQDERNQAASSDNDERVVRDRLFNLLAEPIELLGPWFADELTLDVALTRLSALLDAELMVACDIDLQATVVNFSSPQRDTVERRLRPVLTELGLALEQSLVLENQQVRRTLTIVSERAGRRVSLPWPDHEGRGGSVVSVVVDREPRPPRAWVAQGDRPIVEDTFAVQPGWDPGLQGQPDSDYGRLTSSDFSLYGSVYRSWVLNEDAAYNAAPYNLGSAFDVGALFDRPGTINQPLRFGTCLTRSSSGRRLSPVIESSTDSGANWSAYPGQGEVMSDRAGVLLTDDVLPSAILSAAKAGTLRIRITATLTSPDPLEAKRWDGNPFAGPAPTRVLDFSDAYAWRAVASTSIHRDALDSGMLQADAVDDRLALRTKLQEHIAEQPGPDISARLDLVGAWTALRPGDRVRDALGRGIAIDGTPSSFATRDARIHRIDFTFGVLNNAPRTRLRLD